jgi:hypothetical protein
MEGAAAAGETKPMRHRIRIFAVAVAVALALSIVMAAPAQAWPSGDHGARPAAGWWHAAVDALASLFGLDRPVPSRTEPKRGDGSVCIDPNGNPACPAPRPTLQSDGSCSIDPNGSPACHPGS